ncbi:hypothetical protein AAKU52_002363 [Pedobacter sp. CG_S7]|uniref:hypothetical protein n=1 Tax=Pedobacter sp. CG_S7 TaxID=3143930 RepID=UPI00339AA6FB
MQYEINKESYAYKLSQNIKKAVPDFIIKLWFYNKIEILKLGKFNFKRSSEQKEADNKIWLYALLESLPEIEVEIERITIVVHENDEERRQILINPTEFDLSEKWWQLVNPLLEPRRRPGDDKVITLDHPYYSNRNFFRDKIFKENEAK